MTYTFGVFVFDAQALELTREGRRVALEPQPARALALLVARAGEVVARDDMRQAIWGAETHVDYDRGLAYCIGQVRSALGDSAEQPRFVQTLPKRGFRFLAPVGAQAPAAASSERPMASPVPTAPGPASPDVGVPAAVSAVARRAHGPPPRTARRRDGGDAGGGRGGVAHVGRRAAPCRGGVDLRQRDGRPGYDAFVAGLSDVVVTELTNLAPSRLGVVGNAAALRRLRNIRNLKALATEVDADYVVLGQLQRQDDQLRFIVHLIRLSDEVHLWAQRFVRPADDVGGFEQDVVEEAVGAVRGFVLEAPRS